MQKILLIGKFNAISNNVYRSLSGRYNMQFCPAVTEIFDGIFSMVLPHMVIVSMVGLDAEQKSMFFNIRKMCTETPVICIGNAEEFLFFKNELDNSGFHLLERPVTIREIIEAINNQSGNTFDDELDVYSELGKYRRKRLLFIDDSAIQLRAMKGLLQDEYEVSMATSAKEAIKLVHSKLPDIIFLDYDMPGINGRDTFEVLKKDPVSVDIPVVFLTGINDRKKVLSVLTMYPADYLLKPVDKSRILGTIKALLE